MFLLQFMSVDIVKENCLRMLQYLYIQLQKLSRRIIYLHAFKLYIIHKNWECSEDMVSEMPASALG